MFKSVKTLEEAMALVKAGELVKLPLVGTADEVAVMPNGFCDMDVIAVKDEEGNTHFFRAA